MIVGLLVSYKLDGQNDIFYVLISFISLERLICLIKSIAIIMFGYDDSLGKNVDEDSLYFDTELYLFSLNMLSHFINSVPQSRNQFQNNQLNKMGLRGAIIFVSTVALTLTVIMNSDGMYNYRQCNCDCFCRNCSLVRRTFDDLKKKLLG
ncbi:hypothetical protein ABPG74_005299 [Tetrahymena malaccensis]